MTSKISLTGDQTAALEIIAKIEKRSIDDLVQEAVAAYLDTRRQVKQKAFEAGFGAWGPGEDGLAYQERIRSEW